MSASYILRSYEQWKHCITLECGLELTAEFIDKRLLAMQNDNDHYAQQFVRLYGHNHRQQVIAWFKKARETY